MKPPTATDVDFLAGRLHARRSRLADGERLDDLLQLASLTELETEVLPATAASPQRTFQRRLVEELIRETNGCQRYLDRASKALVQWMLLRFRIEDVKVLLRAVHNGIPLGEVRRLLLTPLEAWDLEPKCVDHTTDAAGLLSLLPEGIPRRWLRAAMLEYPHDAGTFFREAYLDREFLRGLLRGTNQLPTEQQEAVVPLVFQEINLHQAMLILRAKFHYGLTGEGLLPLLIDGAGVAMRTWRAMLADSSPLSTARRVVGKVWDELPTSSGVVKGSNNPKLADLEALGWQRFLRMANRSFRRSHMGSGAVLAYLALRRIEVANLIMLSEALRLGSPREAVARRLLRHPT